MLGFTLSKINLLIFVIAIFAIISYFFIGLSEVTVNRIAGEYLLVIKEDVRNILITAPSLCESKTYFLPPKISSSPSGSFSRHLYYKLFIATTEGRKEGSTKLIFYITPRKEEEKAISATSFDVDAEIVLFQFEDLVNADECGSATYSEPSCVSALPTDNKKVFLDPQSAPSPINAFVLIKEVVIGKKYVYIIPCSTEIGASCLLHAERAGRRVHAGKKFDCFGERSEE